MTPAVESTSPLGFATETFEASYEAAQGELKALSLELGRYDVTARVLKGIAVFGGLVLTTGIASRYGWVVQSIGLAIAVAVAYDTWSSNHRKLLSRATACIAYRQLVAEIGAEYNREWQRILEIDEQVQLQREKAALLGRLRTIIDQRMSSIRGALDGANLAILQTLAVSGSKDSTSP